MKWINNLRISTRLISAFVIVALLAGVVGIIGTVNINKTDQDYSHAFDNDGLPLEHIAVIGIFFQKNRVALRDIIIEEDTEVRDEHIASIKANDERLVMQIALFDEHSQSDEMRGMVRNLLSYIEQYKVVGDGIIAAAVAGETEQAAAALRDAAEITALVDSTIGDILGWKVDSAEKAKSAIHDNANKTIVMMISIIISAVLFAIILGIAISRSISRPIQIIVENSERIADGDLAVSVNMSRKDELGQLAAAFNRMSDNLNSVMTNIAAASEQVSASAKQVSASSLSLSQGATEQASSVEQLTVSLEDITSKINENASGATEAARVSSLMREEAIQGNEQMGKMLVAMEDINVSSDSISKIIKVIDEIAFQTNILALNAAVEAARAGQHGKGFAVVAEEVRNLAARSANAAKETAEMIEGSIKKVDDGMKIANQTAASLKDIVKAISEINEISITSAENAKEQAIGVSQINQGLMQVSQVIQTNSATSEENAAASEELTEQANTMQQQVVRFKLKSNTMDLSFNRFETSTLDYRLADKLNNLQDITLSEKDFGKY